MIVKLYRGGLFLGIQTDAVRRETILNPEQSKMSGSQYNC